MLCNEKHYATQFLHQIELPKWLRPVSCYSPSSATRYPNSSNPLKAMAREPPIVVPVCRIRKYLSVKHQIICWCLCCHYRTCMVLQGGAGSSASPLDHTIYLHPQTKDPFDAHSAHPTSARHSKLLAPSFCNQQLIS